MPEVLILSVLVGVLIVPTFYGLWRAARTREWGWFAWIVAAWVFGVGWFVALIFLLAYDRKARVA